MIGFIVVLQIPKICFFFSFLLQIVVKCLFTYSITVQNVISNFTGNIKFGA